MIGKTVLHYRIIEKLGEGGMGVVYKAEDKKLDRIVALKPLPPYVAVNNEQRERFIIEAKAAAGLNHSNIATIYAILENKEEAYSWLQKSIDLGWNDYRIALRDPFFENLRHEARFKQLMAQVKARVDEMRRHVQELRL